jgi:hypothetical protein
MTRKGQKRFIKASFSGAIVGAPYWSIYESQPKITPRSLFMHGQRLPLTNG